MAKSYEKIVAPLKKMLDNLRKYVEEHNTNIETYKNQKVQIENNYKSQTKDMNNKIKTSELEIVKSNKSIDKLKDIVVE